MPCCFKKKKEEKRKSVTLLICYEKKEFFKEYFSKNKKLMILLIISIFAGGLILASYTKIGKIEAKIDEIESTIASNGTQLATMRKELDGGNVLFVEMFNSAAKELDASKSKQESKELATSRSESKRDLMAQEKINILDLQASAFLPNFSFQFNGNDCCKKKKKI